MDREVTPWIVTMFHCPWYNSNTAHQGERQAETAMRVMEPLLYAHKVAVVVTGHVHGELNINCLSPGDSKVFGITESGRESCFAWSMPRFLCVLLVDTPLDVHMS